MKQQTKIFLLVALSFLSSFNLSANDTFFSIEKSSDGLEVLANAGSDLYKSFSSVLKGSYDDLVLKGLKAVEDAGVVKFLDNSGIQLAEISGGKLKFKYAGFGGDVVMAEGKSTTVLGKFAEDFGNPSSGGTRNFLGSNANPVVDGFPNGVISRGAGDAIPNRMNFLDIPEPQYNSLINGGVKEELDLFLGNTSSLNLGSKSLDDVKSLIRNNHPSISELQLDDIISGGLTKGNNNFWDTYNLPFLEQAFQRGDDIRLVSDPSIYQPSSVIGGTYKRELDAITGSGGFSSKYGYSYNSSTKTYYKP